MVSQAQISLSHMLTCWPHRFKRTSRFLPEVNQRPS